MKIPAPQLSRPVVLQQVQYLGNLVSQLDSAAKNAHALRNTQNTASNWAPVGASIRDAFKAATILNEHAYDLGGLQGARFRDIEVRSAISDARKPLQRADDPDLTAIGRSRIYGEVAKQLVEARDVARHEFEAVWDAYAVPRGGQNQTNLYYSLVGGTTNPLPKRADDQF